MRPFSVKGHPRQPHLHGSSDDEIPVAAGKSLAKTTGGQFILIDDSDHYVYIAQPELVSELIVEFASD